MATKRKTAVKRKPRPRKAVVAKQTETQDVEKQEVEAKPSETVQESTENVQKVEEPQKAARVDKKTVAASPGEHFKINGVPQYWNNKVLVVGKGLTWGAVTVEDKRKFFSASPNSNLLDWMSDYDPIQKRIDDAKAKARRKLGLDKDN